MNNKQTKLKRKQLLLNNIDQSSPIKTKKKEDNPHYKHSLTQPKPHQQEQQQQPLLILDDSSFQQITSILTKTIRKDNDLIILQTYLKSISQFTSLMEKSIYCKSIDDVLYQIASMLKYEKKHCNTILFRQGDKGNKFYIVFKGTASVLILKETKVSMNYKNYLKHLIYLKLIKEDEICFKTIHFNLLQYYIEEKEIDEFINELGLGKQQHFIRKTVQIPIEEMKDFELFYREVKGISINVINRLSAKEYIELSKPLKMLIDVSGLSNEISTFVYYEITTKPRGDCFGEIALFQGNTKRTATILCNEDCTFGTLTREAYNSTIRDIQNKIRKNNVNFLLRYKLFSELNYAIFESKFFNFFIEKKIVQGQYLIVQGCKRNEIQFIREGDFELVTRCNNKELAEIIRIKKRIKAIKRKKIMIEGNDCISDRIGDQDCDGEYNGESNKGKLYEQNYRIAIVRQNDVIGLNDLTYDDKYVCSARCISPNALIYSIEVHILNEIKRKIPRVERDLNEMVQPREEFILNRLLQMLQYANDQQKKKDAKNVKMITLLKLFNNSNESQSNSNNNNNKTINTTTKCNSKLISTFQLNRACRTNNIITKSRNKLRNYTNVSTIAKSLLKHPITNTNANANVKGNVNACDNNDNNNNTNTLSNTLCLKSPMTKQRLQTAHNAKHLITTSISLRTRTCTLTRDREQSAFRPKINKQKLLKEIMGSLYKQRTETNESKRLSSALTMKNEDKSLSKTNDSIMHQGIIDSKKSFPTRRVIVDFLLYDNYVNTTNKMPTFITSSMQNKIKYFTPIKQVPVNYFNKARPLRITCLKKTI